MKKKKEDKSAHVANQREKINFNLEIHQKHNLTERQKQFIDLANSKECKIILVKGPAGSAKTFLSTYVALNMLNNGTVRELLYIRSAVESSDSKIGFLPGSAEEKMSHYGVPLSEKLDELLPTSQVNRLVNEDVIKVVPVGFTRGLNWNGKAILIDEAQNLTSKELITLLTRIGKFSKCFVLADPSQSDINGKSGAFEAICDLFDTDEAEKQGIYYFELTEEDILRSELCKFLVGEFKRLRSPQKH